MVRAAFDHFSDVFSFLVDWHSPDDSSLRWWGHHFDLDGTCLGDLAVELFQFGGILNGEQTKESEVQPGTKAHQEQGDDIAHVTESTSHCMGTAFVCIKAMHPEGTEPLDLYLL